MIAGMANGMAMRSSVRVSPAPSIIGRDGDGNDQRPYAIDQSKSLYDQIARDHAAVKKHCEEHEKHHAVAAGQILFGKGIREQDRQRNVDGRAHHRDKNGYAIGIENAAIIEKQPVGVQRDVAGNDHKAAIAQHLGIGREGNGNHVHQGKNAQDGKSA